MFAAVAKSIFGSANDRYVRGLGKYVDAVNALEPNINALSDDELKGQTELFRQRLANGERLDDLLPEAFATVREAAIRTLGSCPGFGAVLRATLHRRILATEPVGAPVTVAIGDRDRMLPRRQARHIDQLPPGTHAADLPGCGHVPMSDDPGAVTALIICSAARAVTTGPGAGPASDHQRG